MRTPTTIEALEDAIAMLEDIAKGKSWSAVEHHERLQVFRDARDEHHRTAMRDERTRAQLRELSAQARGRRLG